MKNFARALVGALAVFASSCGGRGAPSAAGNADASVDARSLTTSAARSISKPTPLGAVAQHSIFTPRVDVDGKLAVDLAQPRLSAHFDAHGAALTRRAVSASAPAEAEASLQVVTFGRERALHPIGDAAPAIDGKRVVYARAQGVTEWYAATARGLEQGFDVARKPDGDGQLVVAMRAPGLIAEANAQGTSIMLRDAHGHDAFGFGDAKSMDAHGRVLPTSLSVHGGQIEVHVDDADATYPIVIDPLLFWVLQQTLYASDETSSLGFGGTLDSSTPTVAAVGNTVVVGAYTANLTNGAAFVFSGPPWEQVIELVASDGQAGDAFGSTVAFDGTTMVVSSPNANGYAGAVYVFTEVGSTWTQVAKLTAATPTADDRFGASVAVSGSTIAVGAPGNAGAVHLFVGAGASWTLQAKIAGASDAFGTEVALAGDTLAASQPGSHELTVYARSSGVWSAQQTIVPPTSGGTWYGGALALQGTTLVVGAPAANSNLGAFYVYGQSATTWSSKATVKYPGSGSGTVGFGGALSLDGGQLVVGGTNTYEAYVFSTSDPSWTPTFLGYYGHGSISEGQIFAISDSTTNQLDILGQPVSGWTSVGTVSPSGPLSATGFGWSTALDGTRALIGATGTNNGAGAAYLFAQSGTTWSQQAKLVASGASTSLGYAVAMKGSVVAASENGGKNYIHIFTGSGSSWSESQTLNPGFDTEALATDGTTLVAGSYGNPINVYTMSGTTWSLQAALPLPAGADPSSGESVAVSGNIIASGGYSTTGTAYVFTRTGTTWGAGVPIVGPASAPGASVEAHVALADGWFLETLDGLNTLKGSAYIFQQSGTSWSQVYSVTSSEYRYGWTAGITSTGAVVGGIGNLSFYSYSSSVWSARNVVPTGYTGWNLAIDGSQTIVGSFDALGSAGVVQAFAGELANIGSACTANTDCSSGFCTDGVCCNSACGSSCEACDVGGSIGACTPLPAGALPHGPRTACSTVGVGTPCAFTCNGTDTATCHSPGSSVACGSPSCASTTNATLVGSCDTAGHCTQPNEACAPYECSGTACLTTCAHDSDCQSGNWCNSSSQCVAVYAQGATCSNNDQCSTGACIAGICCNSAPSGCPSGEACSFPGHLGTCLKNDAQSCTVNSDCGSNFCVDGYCCNSACGGQCQACDVPSAIGSCIAVTGAPHGTTRSACSNGGSNVCAARTCDGTVTASCNGYANGSTYACASPTCASSSATPTEYCDGAGSCKAAASTPCAPYICGSTACSTTCNVDGNCASNAWCTTAHACQTKSNNGATCSASDQCSSGNCVDGYCCNVACGGTCQACDVAGSQGTCTALSAGATPHGSRSACGGTGAGMTCGSQCTGSSDGACHFPTTSTACGSATCTGTTQTAVGTCNGAGACAQTSTACNGFACGATACNATCTTSTEATDCASGYYCSGGKCVADVGLGAACSASVPCTGTLSCTDGVCCTSSSCGAGATCDYSAALAGSCKNNNGTSCASNSACGSGFCVDGVCCNSACTGLCQSCGNTTGTCTTLPTGSTPLPAHGTCSGASTSSSCAQTCNGSDPIACHYPGSAVTCGSTSCAAGKETDVGACDGAGNCTQHGPYCSPYLCSGTTCGNECGADTDCASGNYCNASHQCVAQAAIGAPCSANDQCASGSFCTDGVCCGASSCGACGACNGSLPGTCTPVGHDSAPRGTCGGILCNGATTSCPATCSSDGDCVAGSYCNAAQACAPKAANGASCTASDQCTSGACTDGVCCTAASCGACGTCDGSAPGTCTSLPLDASPKTPCGAYLCGGTATTCPSSCATDLDCVTGDYCDASSKCVAQLPQGSLCMANDQCSTSYCTDGVCCGVGSCGAGSACDLAGHVGTCSESNGTTCTSNGQCGSNHCVDGYCCDLACTGECQACDVAGSVGTCQAVVGAPHGARTPCDSLAANDCGHKVCDGTAIASCNAYANGLTTSCGAASCSGHNLIGAPSCNGAGACVGPPATSCAPFDCSAGACQSNCMSDSDCNAGTYCSATTCVAQQSLGAPCGTANDECASGFCTDGVCCSVAACASGSACNVAGSLGSCIEKNGSACSAGSDCGSGHCVDGVCCDQPCGGECQACDVAGSQGTCTPVVGPPHGARAPCDAKSATDCAHRVCDGATTASCVGYANGTSTTCGAGMATCSGSNLLAAPTCTGTGACGTVTPQSCAPYACDATTLACKSTCAVDGDCASGSYCASGICTPSGAVGTPCTGNDACVSGFCVDAVCCGVPSCDAGQACNVAGHLGACTKVNGTICATATECGSGQCVDGVCCDQTCADQCAACDVAGHAGTCTPVVGAPQGSRGACDALTANDCGKRQCDGTTTATCQGFANGSSTTCGAPSCSSDQVVGASTCDGAGNCNAPAPSSCVPFTCESGACATTCTVDTDCAKGFTCDAPSGKCVQGATCTSDKTGSTDKSGNTTLCAPYLCVTSGVCGSTCADSNACASGFVCDPSSSHCVAIGPSAPTGGGCGTAPRNQRSDGLAAVGLIGVATIASSLRRRDRARRAGSTRR